MQPADGRTSFLYTPHGQDRILSGYTNAYTTEYTPGPNSNQENIGNVDISPQDIIVDGEFNTTGPQTVTNSDSSAYGSFMREYRETPTAWPELDDKTDYCYKGRVDDELLYRPTIVGQEVIRCKPCSLGLGTGVYYTMPTRTKKAAPGNRERMPGSMSNKLRFTGCAPEEHLLHYLANEHVDYLTASYDTPLPAKQNSFLGRLLRGYDMPEPETLHYTNRAVPNMDQRYQLAIQRPSINIEMQTLHLPGCRFPMINALESDFTHGTYRARPWDDKYSTFCGPEDICGDNEPSLLNVTKVIGTDDNEFLVFDDVAYSADGNGLIPDIPSLDNHTLAGNALFDSEDVIHAIYSDRAEDNPYVTLDQLCDYPNYQNTIEIIEVDGPLFTSHNQCEGTTYYDYKDGYACISDFQPYSGIDISLGGLWQDIIDGMEIPTRPPGDPTTTYLIQFNSGILNSTGLRLDCGCLILDCNRTDVERLWVEVDDDGFQVFDHSSLCSIDSYYDQDGEIDVNCDHIVVERILKPEETIGTCSIRLDGTIPTLLETV
jgi:hypothetical protein